MQPDHTAEYSRPGAQAQAVRLAMEASWRQGDRRPLESYLQQLPQMAIDDDGLLDCIYGEYVLREQFGESPQTEEYLRRFPQFSEKLRRLFQVDAALLASGASTDRPVERETIAGSPPSAAHPAAQPDSLGKYRVLGIIAAGGQGVVYRALHPTLQTDVVIKLLHGPAAGADEREALIQEGRVLASLDHPLLARVYDIDFLGEQPYLVMEFIRGRTLEQQATHQRPTPAQAGAWVAQIARAVDVAHRRGITHRDIKPRNILIEENGRPRLIDFGLAQQRDAWRDQRDPDGSIAGTLFYMAPEQARSEGSSIGPRSDVYALGAVLYYLLTGRAPVQGPNTLMQLEMVTTGQIDWSALDAAKAPRRLKAVCRRALALDPRDRPADGAALADLVEKALKPRWPSLVAGFAVVAALAFGLAYAFRPGPDPVAPGLSDPGKAPPAAAFNYDDKRPTLQLRVNDKRGPGKLLARLPLRTGKSGLRAEIKPPPGVKLSLFLWDSEGKVRELAVAGPLAEEGVWSVPEKSDEFATVAGKPGTELWLVCGRRDKALSLDELRPLLEPGGVWPTLPPLAVWRLQRSQVIEEEGSRDFGAIQRAQDPEAEVARRLESLRVALRGKVDYLEGLAFSHGK